MSTSSVPTVIDLVLAKLRSLSACQPPVEVYDGMAGPDQPMTYVTVGGTENPTAIGSVRWAELGAHATWEEYEVECSIWSWVGGDNNSAQATNDAQKTARDNVFTLYNAIDAALLSDLTLAAQQGSGMPVQWQGINRIGLHQTPVTPEDDGSYGRAARLDFAIYVKARVTQG